MIPHFERIHDTGEVARAEAMAFWEREKAPLRLGVMCTIGPERMVDLFARLRSEIPSLDVELKEAPGSALVEHLMGGDLDIALVGQIGRASCRERV
jgi:DNA-binding transcriptional LysR family regulator